MCVCAKMKAANKFIFLPNFKNESFNRDWRYHKEERVWITRAPGMEPTMKTNTYERGTYYFFDCLNWRKVAKVSLFPYAEREGECVCVHAHACAYPFFLFVFQLLSKFPFITHLSDFDFRCRRILRVPLKCWFIIGEEDPFHFLFL